MGFRCWRMSYNVSNMDCICCWPRIPQYTIINSLYCTHCLTSVEQAPFSSRYSSYAYTSEFTFVFRSVLKCRFDLWWQRHSHLQMPTVAVLGLTLCCMCLLWTHAQRCVHVIFCRCFLYFFYGHLSWPNGWRDLHEAFTRGRYSVLYANLLDQFIPGPP